MAVAQYVNVYLVERVPVEGSDDSYEIGRLVSSVPYTPEAYAQATAETHQENVGQPLSSVLSRGIYVVRVQDFPGEDYGDDRL